MHVKLSDSAFTPVAEEFKRAAPENGAVSELCLYQNGRQVLFAHAGDAAPEKDVQLLRSISKAILAVLAAMAHESGELDMDAPVADVWPEFAANGKHTITGRQLLSHQAGLPVFDEPVSTVDALTWHPVVDLLARQRPRWEPGTAHGYHDLTFGWLVGEWLRRGCEGPADTSIGVLVDQRLRISLELKLWIGSPIDLLSRVRPLQHDRRAPRVLMPEGAAHDLVEAALGNPDLVPLEHTMEYLTAEVPAANAVGDAVSLARMFSALVATTDGTRLLCPGGVEKAAAVQADGPDLVVGWPRRYGSGFMLPDPNRPMGGLHTASFGHYGQGGSLVFAHADSAFAFGYTTSQDRSFLGADPRTKTLAAVALECAAGCPLEIPETARYAGLRRK
ncbi:beta-lactamase family protein [Nocardia speluncae]|uniref:Beta-lactamase family protein n=1 Tax=Nocardia speluncae TaxID=419477 RepID=A0A846XFB2_9NOCA|nr:serine hydrolase domain-containing protein [Nocardia speluncae]NKY33859.1 beta-lactamase family protein [Nocardia speluncae]